MATNGLSERSASQSGSVHCRNTRKTVCQKVIQAKYIQKIEQNEPRQSLSRAPRYHHAPHPHRAFSMDHTAGHLVLSPTTFSLGWQCAQHHLWAVRAARRESPRTPPRHRGFFYIFAGGILASGENVSQGQSLLDAWDHAGTSIWRWPQHRKAAVPSRRTRRK